MSERRVSVYTELFKGMYVFLDNNRDLHDTYDVSEALFSQTASMRF